MGKVCDRKEKEAGDGRRRSEEEMRSSSTIERITGDAEERSGTRKDSNAKIGKSKAGAKDDDPGAIEGRKVDVNGRVTCILV